MWYFGWAYPITIPLLSLWSHINPLTLYGIECIIPTLVHMSGPVPPSSPAAPSNISPVCSRSKAMVGILNSTKALRPENGVFFVAESAGGISLLSIVVGSTTALGWKSMVRTILRQRKTWKNIMSLKKNVCLRSSKTFLGTEKKIGRPHRLTLLPAYSQDVGGGKCCDMTWDWDLKGHDMPEPLLGMGQNHSKPFKTHINPKIAGTWIFNLP